MKKLFLISVLLAAAVTAALAQTYPFYTIRQIQQVPAESLAVADTITNFSQNTNQPRWTLQTSPHNGRYSHDRRHCCRASGCDHVHDGHLDHAAVRYCGRSTTSGEEFSSGPMLADTTLLKQDGFLNVSPGDIITLTGVISEFPTLPRFQRHAVRAAGRETHHDHRVGARTAAETHCQEHW